MPAICRRTLSSRWSRPRFGHDTKTPSVRIDTPQSGSRCAAIARPALRVLLQERQRGRSEDIVIGSEKVENVILGGGEPGKYLAWELAREGHRTVVVERALIGGSCPNIACLPSKNVIHSAKVADLVRHAADYGER